MRKTGIYAFTARTLIALLSLVMVTVLLRIFVYRTCVERLALRGGLISAIMFDCPELTEPSAPEEPPQTDTSADLPAKEPVRDMDGIIWSTKVDWEALYPPYEPEQSHEESGIFRAFSHALDRTKERFSPVDTAAAEFEEALDGYTTDYVVFYSEMVEAANAYDKLLGWEIAGVGSYNPVIEAGENYFLTCVARTDENPRAAKSIELDAFLAEHGMQHLFVETPNKTCRSDPQSGVADFYNQNADRLLAALREGGVAVMDLRENLHNAGMDHHASFFQTDHHWKAETGLWAAGELARRLNEDFGFSIDLSLLASEQFRADVYERWFLGSQGKKVTLSRAEPEDISLLYPTYPVDLSIEIPSLSVSKHGGFSIMYRYAAVNTCDYYNLNPYAAYLYGDNALTRITNHAAANEDRVLLLGHSFDNSVIPFLALGVSEVDSIDLREFKGDLRTFLSENQYDVVVEFYTV